MCLDPCIAWQRTSIAAAHPRGGRELFDATKKPLRRPVHALRANSLLQLLQMLMLMLIQ